MNYITDTITENNSTSTRQHLYYLLWPKIHFANVAGMFGGQDITDDYVCKIQKIVYPSGDLAAM